MTQNNWGALSLADRKIRLLEFVSILSAHREAWAQMIFEETAKPLAWAQGEVDFCINSWSPTLEECEKALETQVFEGAPAEESKIYFRPRGHVVIFSPFNASLECTQLGLLSALMAGNQVTVKISPKAVRAVTEYVESLNKVTGAPVSIFCGTDEATQNFLNSGYDMLVFTGGETVGKKLALHAANNLKPVVLELGGKDLLIVRPDADLTAAAEFIIQNAFGFCGQTCTASEQIFAHSSIKNRLVGALNTALSKAEPLDFSRLDSKHMDRIEKLASEALDQGATTLAGSIQQGLILDVSLAKANLQVFEQEIFGPIACLHTYESEDEIVQFANKLGFGLGVVIYTSSSVSELAPRLPHAMVGTNGPCVGTQGTPWLGRGRSGFGLLGSLDGHRLFAVPQVITTRN